MLLLIKLQNVFFLVFQEFNFDFFFSFWYFSCYPCTFLFCERFIFVVEYFWTLTLSIFNEWENHQIGGQLSAHQIHLVQGPNVLLITNQCGEVYMYINIKEIFIYLVRSMPWSSFFERSNSVRLLEAHDELFGRIISGPFYNFVQTIFPVSIVICTRSLVEVKIEKVVIRQHFLLHKLIHGVQTVHFYVLQISFRSDSFKWMQWSEVSIENKW